MQEQVSKQKRQDATDETVVEADRSKTDEVLAECDSCLSEIDAVLDEHENRELTDQEILDKGVPTVSQEEWDAFYKGLDELQDRDHEAVLAYNEEFFKDYRAAYERYKAAYLAIMGMEYDACTC